MLGYISYGDGPRRPAPERRQLLGASFAMLRMAEGPGGLLGRRRAAAAARSLRAVGVRRAVLPADFPWKSLFAQQGVAPMDVLPLRRALAVPLVQRQLAERGLGGTQAVVAVSGQHLSRELLEATRALAIHYRYVLLDVPGGEEVARSLRREFGVSLLLSGPEQLRRADALLLYSPREGLPGENDICYALYPSGELGWHGARYGLPAALAQQVEPRCCREQLLAALYAAGALPLEDILAEMEVDRTEKYRYNA